MTTMDHCDDKDDLGKVVVPFHDPVFDVVDPSCLLVQPEDDRIVIQGDNNIITIG